MKKRPAVIGPDPAPARCSRGGAGEPLLYLHHLAGMQGWEPALSELSTKFDVIAPYHPGFGPSEGLDEVDNGLDLVLHYIDFLDYLGLESVRVLGHSFGAWIAAELAALYPDRVSRLVLANPVGIWQEDIGGEDVFAQNPTKPTEVLFAEPQLRENLILRDGTVDPLETYVQEQKDLKAAAKFLWPIPDTGVARRLGRITAPTLVVGSTADKFIPPAYAGVWKRHIANSDIKTIVNAGHLVNLEQPSRFATVAGSWLIQP